MKMNSVIDYNTTTKLDRNAWQEQGLTLDLLDTNSTGVLHHRHLNVNATIAKMSKTHPGHLHCILRERVH